MFRIVATVFFCSLSLFCVGNDAETSRPLVLSSFPPNGARDVDPDLPELRVVFSEPMSTTSWSWCGGGPRYPPIDGEPRFSGDRTAVLPVKLASMRTYSLMVNCPSGQGFRTADGRPAEPYLLRFTTGYRLGDIVTSDSRNRKALEEFWRLFSTRYGYFETFGIPWEAKFRRAKPWLMSSPDAEEFALRLAIFLEEAADPHLQVVFPDGSREATYRRHARYNANEEAVLAAFPSLRKHNSSVWSGRRGDLGYIAIRSWSSGDGELDAAQVALNNLLDTEALILDVRANGGGSETEAQRVAGRFIDRPILYARNRVRDPESPGGYTAMWERWVQPETESVAYGKPVFVLMGPVCLSSNESFLQMMAEAPHATLVGEPSGGSSANPRTWPLPNGVGVTMAQWEDYLPDGTLLERHGVQPDVKVTGDFTSTDPVLERALVLAQEAASEGTE